MKFPRTSACKCFFNIFTKLLLLFCYFRCLLNLNGTPLLGGLLGGTGLLGGGGNGGGGLLGGVLGGGQGGGNGLLGGLLGR